MVTDAHIWNWEVTATTAWLAGAIPVLCLGGFIAVLGAWWRRAKRSIRASQAHLQGSDLRYRAILNASPDAIFITNLESGRHVMLSPGGAKMFGWEQEDEMLGQLWLDGIEPADRARAAADIGLMVQGQRPGPSQYRALRADGSVFDIEAHRDLVMDSDGQAIQMVTVVRDITERKQIENYRQMDVEILAILTREGTLQEIFQQILTLIKAGTGSDAVGIRLQEEDDFPYIVQQGFGEDFRFGMVHLHQQRPVPGVP